VGGRRLPTHGNLFIIYSLFPISSMLLMTGTTLLINPPFLYVSFISFLLNFSLKSAATSAVAGGAKPLRKRTRRTTTTTHLPPQTTNALPTPLPNSQQHIPHQNQPTPIHAQSNGNSLHRRGTNRRKSASVKRFKKEESASQSAPYVGNNINTHKLITDAKTASNIVKIIKAIGYSTSLSCYKQDILVTFMAMRLVTQTPQFILTPLLL